MADTPAVRGQLREWGEDFRRHALELDADPEAIRRHFDLPAVAYLATMGIPAEYGNDPEPIGGQRILGTTAAERVVVMEELSCADAGMLVASPGPLLAGVLISLVADEQQRRWFFERMLERPLWTCFALTEPDSGSDAGALHTTLKKHRLTGTKRYVGNACRAQVGVVFARTKPGPLGIVAALVDAEHDPGYTAEPLPMLGLRGARISAVHLDAVAVPDEFVLGRHLSPTRRGMWAFVRTFNLLRPGVAAIALGMARAAYDYVVANRGPLRTADADRLAELGHRIDATRELVRLAAAAVDRDPTDGHLASAAKARACQLAEDATRTACGFFGPGARLAHPLLDKLVRDARGMEYIEGTANMQRLNLFQSLLTGKLDRRDPFRLAG